MLGTVIQLAALFGCAFAGGLGGVVLCDLLWSRYLDPARRRRPR